MNSIQILKELDSWPMANLLDLQVSLKNLVNEKKREINKARLMNENSQPVIQHVTDYFESWENGQMPPLLNRSNIAAGRQFRLTVEQMSFIRNKLGSAVGSSVVVPYDIELDLDGTPIAFAAKVGISPKAPRHHVRYFHLSGSDAEVFFRLPVGDQSLGTTKSRGNGAETRKRNREAELLKALLGA